MSGSSFCPAPMHGTVSVSMCSICVRASTRDAPATASKPMPSVSIHSAMRAADESFESFENVVEPHRAHVSHLGDRRAVGGSVQRTDAATLHVEVARIPRAHDEERRFGVAVADRERQDPNPLSRQALVRRHQVEVARIRLERDDLGRRQHAPKP